MSEDNDKKKSNEKKWTDEERLELAAKLDNELDEYINSLEKKKYTEGWPEDRWQEEMEKHPFFMKEIPESGEVSPLMEGLQQLKYSEEDNTPDGFILFINLFVSLKMFICHQYNVYSF